MNCIAAQGEIRVFTVNKLPAARTLKPFEREKGKLIIGHSETGHHHVLEAEEVETWETKEAPEGIKIRFALLKTPGELKHLREHDTHMTIKLEPGLYMFRTDREYDPYGELARTSAD